MSGAKGAQWWCTYVLSKTINCSHGSQFQDSGPLSLNSVGLLVLMCSKIIIIDLGTWKGQSKH